MEFKPGGIRGPHSYGYVTTLFSGTAPPSNTGLIPGNPCVFEGELKHPESDDDASGSRKLW